MQPYSDSFNNVQEVCINAFSTVSFNLINNRLRNTRLRYNLMILDELLFYLFSPFLILRNSIIAQNTSFNWYKLLDMIIVNDESYVHIHLVTFRKFLSRLSNI